MHELIFFLPLVVAAAPTEAAPLGPDWWGALAGLHPLVIHFPIALVIVAACVEFFGMITRRERITSFTVIAFVVSGVLAGIAAWSGWILADEGYGSGWALSLHRWLGVASAVLIAALAIIALIAWFSGRAWSVATVRAGSFIAALLIGVTAHFGGEMVWGGSLLKDALFPEQPGAPAQQESNESVPKQDADDDDAPSVPSASSSASQVQKVTFERDVQPIFDKYCWKCHGPQGRAKAGIRLSTKAEMFRDLDGVSLVVPGDPKNSLVHEVIVLPRDADGAMPPKGPGLSAEEIQIVTTWIEEGAVFDPSTAAAAPRNESAPVTPATKEEKPQDAKSTATAQDPAMTAAMNQLKSRGIPARQISQQSQELELNANGLSHRITPPFGDADMTLLNGLQSVLVEIDLSNTAVTDAGVASLNGFDLLNDVKIKDTKTGDGSAKVLSTLPALTSVNMYGTELTDAGLLMLASNASIKRIYAGESKVTQSGVDAAKGQNAEVLIVWQAATNAVGTPSTAPAQQVSFKTSIEPILAANCWQCHGPNGKHFKLVTRADLLAQHDGAPIVELKQPESSLLFTSVSLPRDADGAMPPKGPGLSGADKAKIQAWILAGAPE